MKTFHLWKNKTVLHVSRFEWTWTSSTSAVASSCFCKKLLWGALHPVTNVRCSARGLKCFPAIVNNSATFFGLSTPCKRHFSKWPQCRPSNVFKYAHVQRGNFNWSQSYYMSSWIFIHSIEFRTGVTKSVREIHPQQTRKTNQAPGFI